MPGTGIRYFQEGHKLAIVVKFFDEQNAQFR